jgi:hypothetical protein
MIKPLKILGLLCLLLVSSAFSYSFAAQAKISQFRAVLVAYDQHWVDLEGNMPIPMVPENKSKFFLDCRQAQGWVRACW